MVAANYVGIHTTKGGTVIEILPKISLGNVSGDQAETKEEFLKMLRHWRGKRFQTLTDSQIRSLRNFPMFEVFVFLFLSNVREIVRNGLARRYLNVEQNLTYLRGRMLFTEHIRENLIDESKFYVSHDELSENRPANRLIHKVLQKLSSISSDSANFQLLQELRIAFTDVPISQNIHADWQEHYVDRTMLFYREVMQWVRLYLFNEGLTTYQGANENISLLFPMEEVFEDFVTHCFRRYQDQYTVKAQSPNKYLARTNGKEVFLMKPDISLMNQEGSVEFILDAKWKQIDAESDDRRHNIVQSDMYQLFAYGKNYQCSVVALVYPATFQFRKHLHYTFADGALSLLCLPFDVKFPETSVKDSLNALQKIQAKAQ